MSETDYQRALRRFRKLVRECSRGIVVLPSFDIKPEDVPPSAFSQRPEAPPEDGAPETFTGPGATR